MLVTGKFVCWPVRGSSFTPVVYYNTSDDGADLEEANGTHSLKYFRRVHRGGFIEIITSAAKVVLIWMRYLQTTPTKIEVDSDRPVRSQTHKLSRRGRGADFHAFPSCRSLVCERFACAAVRNLYLI